MAKRQQNRQRTRGANPFHRQVNTRDIYPAILIVTEGEQTEPNYFEAFRLHNMRIVVANAKGTDPQTVAERALELKEEARRRKEPYASVWIVFDRDSHSLDRFNRAFVLATEHDIRVAYSNPCFEVWYLLHFKYFDTRIHRTECIQQLKSALGGKYAKNDITMNARLRSRIKDALSNAEKQFEGVVGGQTPDPAKDCPTTTVHRLVAYLLKYER